MAFQQALSGLSASAKAIDVTSNNIANASTVGFKTGNAQFADIFGSALTGAANTGQVGIGATAYTVKQSFTQGGLTSSGNPLDMAINGNGFFVVQRNDGTSAYTRNGQFEVDRFGNIVTALGEQLMGVPAGAVGAAPSSMDALVPLSVPTQPISPRATSDEAGVPAVAVTANLDARSVAPTDPTDPTVQPAPNPADSTTYNATTSIDVYDSLGRPHTLSLYLSKDLAAGGNSWQVWGALDGGTPTRLSNQLGDPALDELLTFSAGGLPEGGAAGTRFEFDPGAVGGGADFAPFTLDLASMTQFGADFSVTRLVQNGYGPGELAGISVNREGIVLGSYTNGQTRDLGQVALATFTNPNGLISLGNNLWEASLDAGAPVPGVPGQGQNGVLSSGVVEESNVDLTKELVQLIIMQRNYQANAQSIRTQDQLLQTVVNLR